MTYFNVAGASIITTITCVINLAVAKIRLTAAWSDMREHRDKNIQPKTDCSPHGTGRLLEG